MGDPYNAWWSMYGPYNAGCSMYGSYNVRWSMCDHVMSGGVCMTISNDCLYGWPM